ncbi:MAG: S4 domain-containing protein, partial [Acidimicrobiales bacterium]|nr:S4 domain-containing protein [Acidimicrobiales bacterium]
MSHREPHPEGERLQKILARVGFGSRRVCEEMIAEGRVTVDGVVAVDGAPVGVRPDLVYYLLNKPAGVITTADDPQGRPTVVDVVPD